MGKQVLAVLVAAIMAAWCVGEAQASDNSAGALTAFFEGNQYYHQGKFAEAVIALTRAIRLKPDFAEAYSSRGGVKALLGRYEESIADSNKAISLNPDDAEVYYNRGFAKAKLGRFGKALTDFEEARNLFAAQYRSGDVGRVEEAIKAIKRRR